MGIVEDIKAVGHDFTVDVEAVAEKVKADAEAIFARTKVEAVAVESTPAQEFAKVIDALLAKVGIKL